MTATAGDQSVTLSWDDPANPSITGYEYQTRRAGVAWSAWTAIANSGAATTSHTVTGLDNGTEYRFKLRAVSAGGNSGAAPTASPWYVAATSGVSLAASNVTYSTATLTLTGHTGSWWYQQVTPSGGECSSFYYGATSTANLGRLTPGVSYTFKAYSDATCATEVTSDATDAEFTTSSVALSTLWHIVPEGESVPHTVWLSHQPSANVTVTVATTGDSDITASPATLTFTPSNWSVPQTVTLSAAQDTDTVPGTGKGDGSYAYGATDVTHTAASSDADFNGVIATLKATEGDDDVCSGTTAVGGSGVTSGAIVEDCDTLLAAKDIINGSGGAVNNWSTGLALNSWTAITVANSRVTKLNLGFQYYAGSDGNVPNTIADLDALTMLNMQSGGRAALPGPLPPGIASLTGLTRLSLYQRELTGQLPANIGDLTALTWLELDANQLSGPLPASMGNLTNLTKLFMSSNRFSGTIPAELGGLTGITASSTYFSLGNNQLIGCIPAGWSKYASQINPQRDADGNDVNLVVCANLAATVNGDKSVDLDLSGGPNNWWFRINSSGACTAVTGTDVNGIQGYQLGTHSVRAYSDSNCNYQIAATSFTLTAGLAATVNGDRSVDLTLSDGPSPWYFRIGGGPCTTVNGTTVSGIKGYAPGYHSVGAFATAGCKDFIADTGFVIPDPPPPTATLTTTVNPGPSVNLTLTNGPSNNNWWFRINWWGSCTAVTGTNTVNNIQGYKAGTHSADAYSDSGCDTKIASSSFIIPDPTLTITVNDDRSVDLTLAGGPTDWWFRIKLSGHCTAASGTTVSGIRGYPSGSHLVAVYPDSDCEFGDHIAAESFTIPTAILTTTVTGNETVDLTLTNGPSNWWFRINWWGGCTSATGNAVNGIAGYQPGTHHVTAYSGSGCKYPMASAPFTIHAPTLTAEGITATGATLTIAYHAGQWWYQADTGPDNTCQGPVAAGTDTKALTGLTAGTSYTYTAYSDSTCATEIASETFTTNASLTASAITTTGATLTLAHATHTANWSLSRTSSGPAVCVPKTSATHNLSNLTAGTTYTYKAYSGSGCTTANEIASETFTTAVTVSNLSESANGTGNVGRQFTTLDTVAQAFTTGSNASGYTFTSATIAFHQTFGSPGDIAVTLRAADSGNASNPASSARATLTGSNPTSNTNATFRCVADSTNSCDLDANTTYFVRIDALDATSGNRYTVSVTDSDNEAKDPSGNGWSIASDGRSGSVTVTTTYWLSLTDVVQLKVTAVPK